MTSENRSPATAIILVNWNNAGDAIECLDALIPTLGIGDHVFLVDNASTDDSLAVTMAWLDNPQPQAAWSRPGDIPSLCATKAGCPVPYAVLDAHGQRLQGQASGSVSVVHSGGNLGFAGGNNVGLRLALQGNFTHFWLLNTDTVVRRDTLAHLLQRQSQGEGIGMVGSTLVHYHRPDSVQAVGGHLNPRNTLVTHVGHGWSLNQVPADPSPTEQQLSYIVGASMLVTREFLNTVGLMQEDYFLYYEELDWAMRAQGRFKLAWSPASLVFHKVGGSSSKPASAFSLNLRYRNHLRFVQRFLPQCMPATLRRLAWELVRHLLKGRWREARLLAGVLAERNTLRASVVQNVTADAR